MARTILTTGRTALTENRNTASSARGTMSAPRWSDAMEFMGATTLWDSRNGRAGLNGVSIPAVIGSAHFGTRNINEGTFYTSGQSYETYDGINDAVVTNPGDYLVSTAKFSAFVWIYRTVSGVTQTLFGHWGALLSRRSWLMQATSGSTIQVLLSTNGNTTAGTITVDGSILSLNTWTLLFLDYDGAGASIVVKYRILGGSLTNTTTTVTSGSIPAALSQPALPQVASGGFIGIAGVVSDPFGGRIGIRGIFPGKNTSDVEKNTIYEETLAVGNYV